MEKCGNENCGLDNSNVEWVSCRGLCGKSFHPICTGVSRRSAAYLKEFSNNFFFFCDECKEISLTHVMLAIKCHKDSSNSRHTELKLLTKKVLDHLVKFDEVIKCVEDLNNTVDSSNELSKTKLTSIEKKLAALNELTTKKSRDALTKSHLTAEISNTASSISNLSSLIEELKLSLHNSIHRDINAVNESISSHSLTVESLAINMAAQMERVEEIQENLNSLRDESASARLAIIEILEELKFASGKIDHISSDNPTPSNKSLHDELLNATPSSPLTETAPPAGSDLFAEPAPLDVPVPVAPASSSVVAQTINRFGTTWTLSEWNSRILKLKGRTPNFNDLTDSLAPVECTTYLLKDASKQANASWVCRFFKENYCITEVRCQRFTPSRRNNSYCFKVMIPSKYDWLFHTREQFLTLGRMTMTKWINKLSNSLPPSTSIKRPIASKIKRNSYQKLNPSSMSHNPSTKNLNKRNPNWSFKMGIFPNFQYKTAAKLSNNNRVSFDLTPVSSAHPKSTSTLSDTPYVTYPNFIRSHVLNPAPPSSSTSSNTATNSTVSSPAFLDPLLPPTVKLTKQFADSGDDGRYVMSRLRDRRIYDNVRLYLAYLHDKPDSTCIDGKTNTNIKVSISQEGLPTDKQSLMQIFIQFHESLNISPLQVTNDLTSYASYISAKRRSHLQRTRADVNNYFRP